MAGAQKVPVVALEAEGALAMRLSTFSTVTVLLVNNSVDGSDVTPRVRAWRGRSAGSAGSAGAAGGALGG